MQGKKTHCNLQPQNDSGYPDHHMKIKNLEKVQKIWLKQVEMKCKILVNPLAKQAESGERVLEGPVLMTSPSTILASLSNLTLGSQLGPSKAMNIYYRAVLSGSANSPNYKPKTSTLVTPQNQDSTLYIPKTPMGMEYAFSKSN